MMLLAEGHHDGPWSPVGHLPPRGDSEGESRDPRKKRPFEAPFRAKCPYIGATSKGPGHAITVTIPTTRTAPSRGMLCHLEGIRIFISTRSKELQQRH